MTKMKNIKKALPFILPPLAVMLILLVNYYRSGLYPFGEGTIAWCDMTQQVIPLLADLKDMIAGKAGIFMNFQNAGGMNMWGVIFFFLASPFSLLVAFVEKTEIIHFVNILLILKLMTCSVTSMVYFRCCQKKLPALLAMTFSIAYAFCGYGMLYYQNIIWLDMMYLFPLLMVSFKKLFEEKKILPYTAVLTGMMVVNYYISYMIVVFILLFMGVFCLRYRKDEKYAQAPFHFIIGSALAAFLSAAVWLPSFAQYLSSGRTESFIEKIQSCGLFASYQTTFPTVLSTVSVLTITAICLADGKKRSKKLGTYLIMLFLMLIPLYIEPINTMWHTGSYMSFPSRYGFITVFLMTACAGYFLSDGDNERFVTEKKYCDNIPVLIVCAALIYVFALFSFDFVQLNKHDFSAYTRGLWGNDTSLHLIIKYAIVAGLVYAIFYFIYRKGIMSKKLLSLFLCVMVVLEAYANVTIYVTSPYDNYPPRAKNQQEVLDLSDRIQDDSGFYRVDTSQKLFDVNLLGSMGYNSISHYTSLTDKDYMFMMKRLGYSSYWMEVGSYGGTELTNALMNIKYTISKNPETENSVYANKSYTIDPSEYYIPSGLVTSGDLSEFKELPEVTRGEIQQQLYENTVGSKGEKLITFYECDEPELITQDAQGKYVFAGSEMEDKIYIYTVDVRGRQSLYFDCFDKPSNNLHEEINNSFSVQVNGRYVESKYPSQASNGLVSLGEFEDEQVMITVRLLEDCTCSSYGVFGLDLDMLRNSLEKSRSVNFSESRGVLTGSYTAKEGESCLLSVPYTDELTIKINGKKVEYGKAFGDLVTFPLEEGENKITVTSFPKGLGIGIAMTVLGIVLCIIYSLLKKMPEPEGIVCKICSAMLIAAGAAVLTVIYIMPLIVNVKANMQQ